MSYDIPIVLDLGTFLIKGGAAGAEVPSLVIPRPGRHGSSSDGEKKTFATNKGTVLWSETENNKEVELGGGGLKFRIKYGRKKERKKSLC